MRNLILFFVKYGYVLIFIGLELLCLFLIVRYNRTQREIWVNSTNIFTGRTASIFDSWTDFYNLKEEAEKLAIENARLRAQVFNSNLATTNTADTLQLEQQQYFLIPAKVINKSINQPDNHFTINRGTNHGVQSGMGVVSIDGIVGIVRKVNAEYASVITIVNWQSKISAANKRSGAFGTLRWRDFTDYLHVQLEAYPRHEELAVGDTIVTSAHSTHFPEGLMIGTVESFTFPKSESFYNIKVALSNNLGTMRHVSVIQNLKQQQQKEVERVDE